MTKVHLDQDAADDLRLLRSTDPKGSLGVLAFVQELVSSPNIAYRLLDKGTDFVWGKEGSFNVTPFSHLYRRGYDIWRIKFKVTPGIQSRYRILYAYDTYSQDFYILAIMARDVNYEQDSAFVERLKQAYNRIGLKVVRLH
ncbi:hypothetical protein A7P25_22065 [Achromobacter xylosoxidans]|nr:hypothetical protein A7P25_22065 [Achromobacter xylosoxidans]